MSEPRVIGFWIVSRFDPTERTEIGVRTGTDPQHVMDGLARKVDFERYWIEPVFAESAASGGSS